MNGITFNQAVVGEAVIVTKTDSEHYDRIGEIWKITNHGHVRVSVEFDGHIYGFGLNDLAIA